MLAPKGIRVNAVAPGPIWTPLQVSGGATMEKLEKFGGQTPMGRAGQPAELGSVIALVPNMVVVNAKVPARTIEEFIALAKQKPGSLNYGTAGAGTAHHLIGEMFKLKTGTNIVHIPYRGSAPALTDLIGGQVQVMFDTVTSTVLWPRRHSLTRSGHLASGS
jgi:hypothetical protein